MPRDPEPVDIEKKLMIKVKTCQRLDKEVLYYKQEVKENEMKLAQMRDNNRDPYDIKKFEEVLSESVMMVPDSQNRWQKSYEDLSLFYMGNKADLNAESDWMKIAKTLLLNSGFITEDEAMNDVAVRTESDMEIPLTKVDEALDVF